MRTTTPTSRGFTLFEIIIVLAVIGILVTILTPRVITYIHDANVARAQADAQSIASAIEKMYRDTARWPFYLDGDGQLAYQTGVDAELLTSSTDCNLQTLEEFADDCDPNYPVDGSTGATWNLAAGIADNLQNHLITNAAGYATTGRKAWKGPYINRIPSTDPWGKSFYVNIANADPDAEGATQKWVIVISAGPNGQLDSEANREVDTNPPVDADDIVVHLK